MKRFPEKLIDGEICATVQRFYRFNRFNLLAGHFPQQCLYFLPLLQGQGSLRPTLGPERMGLAFSIAAAASLTMSLPWAGPFFCGVSAPVVEPPNALVD